MRSIDNLFLKDCALYIRGDLAEVRFSGSKEAVVLFANVLSESRKFYLALESNNIRNVMPQLVKKRKASKALREQTGYIWPL